MVQLKYSQISNPQFRMALQQLAQRPFNIKVSYKIKKWIDSVNKAIEHIQTQYKTEVLELYAEKNADGTFKFENVDDPGSHIITAENRPKIEAANKVFNEKVAEINREKLLLEELGDIDIPAQMLGGLDPILTEKAELEAEANESKLKAVPSER